MRALVLCCAVLAAAQSLRLHAQGGSTARLPLLDVPFLSQSELLCGGAAAAMVLRYWGERGMSAEAFSSLVDRSAAGIPTDALVAELRRRGWSAAGIQGSDETMQRELAMGRPVLTLIEDRPGVFHYIVVVARSVGGIVFHDPARAPFMVMSDAEFDRRWRAADRWMGIVAPPGSVERTGRFASVDVGAGGIMPPPIVPSGGACDQQVADGVRLAQAGQFDAAERVLASALGCPAALRELAGVRVLQKRWLEASDLAAAATREDPADAYAWKVLATSRFVQNDRAGALDAWNRTGEPRLDLVRIDGLTRTRHRVVEQVMGVDAGVVLTGRRFARARRRLSELPAATSTRLEYAPISGGLAELRGTVAERSLLPAGRFTLAAMGITALATREVRASTGSLTGGGEQIFGSWRFWPRRPQVTIGVTAPAAWGGVWNVHAFSSRQSFTDSGRPEADRAGARLGTTDWLTPHLRWSAVGGVDRREGDRTRGTAGAALRLASSGDRVEAQVSTDAWFGRAGYATSDLTLRARSSVDRGGVVVVATAAAQHASRRTPLDLWWAGDTGSARPALLRAHPVLRGGRLRTDRLGRTLFQGSIDVERWWRTPGPVRAAAAVFTDAAQTARRLEGVPRGDLDVGVGVRFGVTGVAGVLRIDLAKGLRDGRTALSFVYQP